MRHYLLLGFLLMVSCRDAHLVVVGERHALSKDGLGLVCVLKLDADRSGWSIGTVIVTHQIIKYDVVNKFILGYAEPYKSDVLELNSRGGWFIVDMDKDKVLENLSEEEFKKLLRSKLQMSPSKCNFKSTDWIPRG